MTHNVARTVTHNGIVAIRDEFRRSWRIIQAVGRGYAPNDGELLAELEEQPKPSKTESTTVSVSVPQPPPAVKSTPVESYAEAFPSLGRAPQTANQSQRRAAPTSVPRFLPSGQLQMPHRTTGKELKAMQSSKVSGKQAGTIGDEQAPAHLQQFKKQW